MSDEDNKKPEAGVSHHTLRPTALPTDLGTFTPSTVNPDANHTPSAPIETTGSGETPPPPPPSKK